MDLEQTAIERLRMASDMSLRLYKQPLVVTYSGGKDSDVLLHLAEASGIPFEALHSLTTADAPETVWHVRDTFRRLELTGVIWVLPNYWNSAGTKIEISLCEYCDKPVKYLSGEDWFDYDEWRREEWSV